MFRRIAGSLSRIFKPSSSVNSHTDLPSSSFIGNGVAKDINNPADLLNKLQNSKQFQAEKAFRAAVKELSANKQQKPQTSSQEEAPSTMASSSEQISELSVKELEQSARDYYSQGSYEQAVITWQLASDKGSIESKFSYAQCLKDGVGIEPNLRKSFELMKELSEIHDYAYAHYTLGLIYDKGLSGISETPNYEKALEAFQKAAEAGIAPAFHNLGNSYAYGKGTPKDEKVAFEYYKIGVELDDAYSAFTLGTWYYKGNHPAAGISSPDLTKSFELSMKAAEQEHPFAMFNVGTALLVGEGVEKDYQAGEKWLRKVHESSTYIPHASINLAKLYMDGLITENGKRDYDEAERILQSIAEKNEIATELINEITERRKEEAVASATTVPLK